MQQLGSLAQELGLQDRIVFTGRVQPDDMNVYYRLAEVSVDPVNDTLADRGRCPLKLFESWQMGIPVVSSDVGDRKLLSGDPPAVLLTEPGNVAGLAETLIEVLSDDELLQKLGESAKVRSLDFDWATLSRAAKEKFEMITKL